MRILFTFTGGSGHVEPMLPIATAARDAGHEIAFTGRATSLVPLTRAGFTTFESGPTWKDPATRMELQEVDVERELRDVRDGFADRIARARAADVVELCERWRPDLLVCEEVDFGGVIAAERMGLPYAGVLVIASGSLIRPDMLAEPLNAIRAEHGLPADPDLEMLRKHLVLSPFPPSHRDPDFPLPPTAHPFRPPMDLAAQTPKWLDESTGTPLVYVTLGTVLNMESGDLFSRILDGLAELPVNLVATVGRQINPAELGPQPPNVRVEQFVPQHALLPHCAAVLTHGGSGSTVGALTHGVPMVMVPMGADQPMNADLCVRLGTGRVLDPIALTPVSVREAMADVLANPGYRAAAGRLRTEIAGLPPASHTVELLERLVAQWRPVRAT
ncbi:MGT family glycosyl transferase [Amycolatopsis antarctica]|uniref:MGT family glycosyl transferase n=1 Tax=Amycolatopsis antarctica TaxID=1854586 RepID=A0A263D5L1_9PSEU|nr:glycosyltransferase [Amycolatopsis antarctica]OZM73328.1 MGT family glycosyl transferase [Amycolatopsis antarctica]